MDTLNLKWISCINNDLRTFPYLEVGDKYPEIFVDEFLHDNGHLGEEDYDPTYHNIDFDNFKGGTAVFACTYGYFIEVTVDKDYRITKITCGSDNDEYDIEEDFEFGEVE